MRVLLDEHLPLDLARDLHGHDVQTVVGGGWAGVKNGDLLRLMRGDYDVLVTMDRSLEFQQNVSALAFGIVLVRAPSSRMLHLQPLVPTILDAIAAAKPGQLHRVGAYTISMGRPC